MVAPNVPRSVARHAGRLSRTLFTAFVLLLTATHCVEIDDRELEELREACEIDEYDDACGVCLKEDCCDTFADCVESSDCVALSDCMYNCGNTDACVDYCVAQYPGGAGPFVEYLTCSSEQCPNECLSTDGA